MRRSARAAEPEMYEGTVDSPDMTKAESGQFRNETIPFPITTYEVFIASSIRIPGTNDTYAAWIRCMGKGKEVLDIYFQEGGGSRLLNTVDAQARRGTLFLSAARLPWVVDILRNEHPVHAYLNHSHPVLNRIHTGREPVGEGELTAAKRRKA